VSASHSSVGKGTPLVLSGEATRTGRATPLCGGQAAMNAAMNAADDSFAQLLKSTQHLATVIQNQQAGNALQQVEHQPSCSSESSWSGRSGSLESNVVVDGVSIDSTLLEQFVMEDDDGLCSDIADIAERSLVQQTLLRHIVGSALNTGMVMMNSGAYEHADLVFTRAIEQLLSLEESLSLALPTSHMQVLRATLEATSKIEMGGRISIHHQILATLVQEGGSNNNNHGGLNEDDLSQLQLPQ